MAEANPYSAPDAALDTGMGTETYQPNILSFNGRLGRMRYLAYGMGISMAFMVVLTLIGTMLGVAVGAAGDVGGVVGILFLVIVYGGAIVLMVMFGKRRLNDLNRSGWWMLLSIVPIANLLLSIYMLFFPGTDGSNNFGPPAVPNSTGVLILAWLVIVFFVGGIVAAVTIPAMMGFQ